MSRTRRGVRALLALSAALVVGSGGAVLGPLTPASAAPASTVTVRVDDVSPSTPVRTTKATPLSVRITLTNTGGTALNNVQILGFRGDPIGNQDALDDSLDDRTVGDSPRPIPATRPLRVNLPVSTPVTTTFTTTSSLLDDGSSGLCLCDNQVYPIQLQARASDGDTLGSTLTYVPSLFKAVEPMQVAWVWPLIDRPHRLVDDTVFTDDDLATSVTAGGRLDAALRTIENLGGQVPITLVVDPELLDELEVMATGNYTVRTAAGSTPGSGQAVAASWLQRFGALLAADPAVRVSLTPYADPDVLSLDEDNLSWDIKLPDDMARRVATALNGRAASRDVAWPAAGQVSRSVLNKLVSSGARTVVLNSSSVSPATSDGSPVAVTRLSTDDGPVTGAMTSPAMQRQVATAVTASAGAASTLPELAAEIAVRAIQSGQQSTRVVLTPPRYVTADPTRAARVIQDTSTSPFSTPVAVGGLADARPESASRLRAVSDDQGLPNSVLRGARSATFDLPTVTSLLGRRTTTTVTLLDGLTRGIQRVTSSAWRTNAPSEFGSATGPTLAGDLSGRMQAILEGVRIVKPASGSYTLGSDNSSLPVTVENTLPYAVDVRVALRARDGLPGYTGKDVGTRVSADTKQTVQVASRLERSGRIQVAAQLMTPSGAALGPSATLYVRSTVFGAIGIAITVGAGGVLALALIVRFTRRLQRLRRKAGTTSPPEDEPSAMATAGEATT